MVPSGCRFLPRLNDNHCSLKDSYVVAWLVVSLDLSIFLSFTDVFCHNQFCLETLVNSGEYRETLTASPSLSLSLSLLLHPRPRSWTLTKASPCRWLTGGASGSIRGELNLIALQPKQDGRAKSDEATLTKVLRDRLQTDDKHLVQSVEKLFRKDNFSNLKMFRIKADFYDEIGSHIGFAVSETIKDTVKGEEGEEERSL